VLLQIHLEFDFIEAFFQIHPGGDSKTPFRGDFGCRFPQPQSGTNTFCWATKERNLDLFYTLENQNETQKIEVWKMIFC